MDIPFGTWFFSRSCRCTNFSFLSRQTPGREAEYNRRMNFYEKANWKAIEELMVGAGLLTETGHDIERTVCDDQTPIAVPYHTVHYSSML